MKLLAAESKSQDTRNLTPREIVTELDRYIETNIDTLFSLEAVGIVELLSGELK